MPQILETLTILQRIKYRVRGLSAISCYLRGKWKPIGGSTPSSRSRPSHWRIFKVACLQRTASGRLRVLLLRMLQKDIFIFIHSRLTTPGFRKEWWYGKFSIPLESFIYTNGQVLSSVISYNYYFI